MIAAFGDVHGAGNTALETSMKSLYANGSPAGGSFPTGTGKGFFGVFYLFHKPSDYTAWAAANGVPAVTVSSTAFEDTALDEKTYQAYYTVVFEQNGNGVANNNITGYSLHEIGHWLDYLLRSDATQTVVVSQSSYFQDEIAHDWTTIAAQTPCFISGHPYGMFTKWADSSSLGYTGKQPYFICNAGSGGNGYGPALNTKYSGLSNKQVLQYNNKTTPGGWAYFFLPGFVTTEPPYEEFFAEGFAATWGPGDESNPPNGNAPTSVDQYFVNQFPCSTAWISYVTNWGTLPTSSNLPAGCPTS